MKNYLRFLSFLAPIFLLHTLASAQEIEAPNYNTSTFNNSVKFDFGSAPLSITNFGQTYPLFFQGNFTFEFWAKITPDYSSGFGQIMTQKEGAIDVGILLACENQDCESVQDLPFIAFKLNTIFPQENRMVMAKIPAYNEWFHVAIVCNHSIGPSGFEFGDPDFNQMNMYINGYAVGPAQTVSASNSMINSTNPLFIGQYSRNLFIDELRIWNVAKYGMGVRATMNEESDPYTNGLVAYYSFNEPAGSGPNKTFKNQSQGVGSGGNALNGGMGPLHFPDLPVYPEWREDRTYVALAGGNWSDPLIWSTGEIPPFNETVTINLPNEYDQIELDNFAHLYSIVFKKGKIRTRGYQITTSTVTAGSSQASYIITDNGFHSGIGEYQLREGGSTYVTLPIGNEDYYLPIKIRNAINSANTRTAPINKVVYHLSPGGKPTNFISNARTTAAVPYYTFHAIARIKDSQGLMAFPDKALTIPWDLYANTYEDGLPIVYKAKFHWYGVHEGPEFDRNHVYIGNYHNGQWRRLGTGAPAENVGPDMYAAAVIVDKFSEFTATSDEDIPLPVRLTNLSAKYENKTAQLNWKTTAETNSDRFEIERSSDTKNWKNIGVVLAAKESTELKEYQFSDPNPLWAGQTAYYRLKMIDADGTYAYSKIIALTSKDKPGDDLFIYSGLTTNEFNIGGDLKSQVKGFEILNTSGQTVKPYQTLKADETIDLNHLPARLYLIRFTLNDDLYKVLKVTGGR